MENKRKQYIQAFYSGNKLLFTLALVTLIISVGTNLLISWVLGEVVDIVSSET